MFITKSILLASIFTILPIINFPWNWKETDKNDKKGGSRSIYQWRLGSSCLSESRSLSVRASGERQTWQTRWLQITNKQSRSDVVITKHPRTQYPILIFYIRSNAQSWGCLVTAPVQTTGPCALAVSPPPLSRHGGQSSDTKDNIKLILNWSQSRPDLE